MMTMREGDLPKGRVIILRGLIDDRAAGIMYMMILGFRSYSGSMMMRIIEGGSNGQLLLIAIYDDDRIIKVIKYIRPLLRAF